MMYKAPSPRLGTTAIAAVLALTAAPLFAQSSAAPAETAAPVVVTPSPAPAPAAPATAPALQTATSAPQSATPVTAPVLAVPTAPSQVARVAPIDIEPMPAEPTPAAKPVVAKAVTRTAPPAKASAPRAIEAAPVAPVAPVVNTQVEAMPVAAVDKPAAQPAPPPVLQATPDDVDMLPIAGIAGLGALALAGGALALRRRKRIPEDAVYAEADIVPEPMVAAPVAPAPVYASGLNQPPAADAPVAALPAGFDISRYGRHVQAAYRGPTPDNPSLSLKNRLKRASFFDQRERMAAMPQEARAPTPAVTPTIDRTPATAPRRTEPAKPHFNWQPNFRPTLQN